MIYFRPKQSIIGPKKVHLDNRCQKTTCRAVEQARTEKVSRVTSGHEEVMIPLSQLRESTPNFGLRLKKLGRIVRVTKKMTQYEWAPGAGPNNGETSVPKSPVYRRVCPSRRAFGQNRPSNARIFVILPVFL